MNKRRITVPENFGHAFEQYLKIRRAANIAHTSLDRESEAHRFFWNWLSGEGFDGNELTVTRDHLLSYAEALHSRRDLHPNTARNKLYILTHFYREAARREWILTNPMAGLKIPRPVRSPVQILTITQMKDLMALPDLTTARGIRDRTMLELFYSCAFRLSEVATLTPACFTDDFRRVRVRGKGNKDAVLPVGRMAAHFTRFYVERIRPVLDRGLTDRLFVSVTTGAALDKHVIYNSLRTYLKQIVPDRSIGTHIFRYSICTHLSEAGVDIRLLQEFMRHEKISTTARYIKRTFSRLQDTHRHTHPRK